MGTHPIFESDFDCLTDMADAEENALFKQLQLWAGANEQEQVLMSCQDRRQNGTCRCIERYIMSDQAQDKQMVRLRHLLEKSRQAERLKFEKNTPAAGGRRYSPDYIKFVDEHKKELASMKLCKKSTVKLLRCSLNFLYARDTDNKRQNVLVMDVNQIREKACCEKNCLGLIDTDQLTQWHEKSQTSRSQDKREVFYDMKEHPSQPCEPAIKEVTRLSKATLNNLRGKSRPNGIRHGLKGRKRGPVGSQGSSHGGSSSSSLPVTPSTPVTPTTPHTMHDQGLHSFRLPGFSETRMDNKQNDLRTLLIPAVNVIKSEPESPASQLSEQVRGMGFSPTYPQDVTASHNLIQSYGGNLFPPHTYSSVYPYGLGILPSPLRTPLSSDAARSPNVFNSPMGTPTYMSPVNNDELSKRSRLGGIASFEAYSDLRVKSASPDQLCIAESESEVHLPSMPASRPVTPPKRRSRKRSMPNLVRLPDPVRDDKAPIPQPSVHTPKITVHTPSIPIESDMPFFSFSTTDANCTNPTNDSKSSESTNPSIQATPNSTNQKKFKNFQLVG